jgi:hypothetical protein
LPVRLLRVVCEAGIGDLLAGHAVLAVSVGDESDSDTRVYWLQAHTDQCGHVTSFRLTKFGTGEAHDLPADLSSCSCGDNTFRPERPGGCRHMAALRQALLAVADRKTERDQHTMDTAEDYAGAV